MHIHSLRLAIKMVGNAKAVALGCLYIAATLCQSVSTNASDRSRESNADCQSQQQDPHKRATYELSDAKKDIRCNRHLPPEAVEKLEKASLSLDRVKIERAVLIGVNLKGVSFREAVLREARLEGANLGCRGGDSNRREEEKCGRAPTMCSDLSKANLTGAKLVYAQLKYANLRNADLTGAELMDADLTGAELEGATLSKAMLDRADLSCANLQNARFEGASLNDTKLHRSNLTKANFSNAKLSNAQLNYAYLRNTVFRKAALDSADLSYAQIIGTDLQDTMLTGAKLKDAKYQSLTTPSEAHLTGLQDLETVRFDDGEQASLVLLRTALQTRGLRDLERKATFAIQSGIEKHDMEKIDKWRESPREALDAMVYRV